MRRPITLLALGLALAACGDGRSGPPTIELPGTAVAYESFPLDWYPTGATWNPAWDLPVRAAVRSREDWDAAWATITGGQGVAPELPAIDFSSEMLLVVSLGMRPNGGYRLTVPAVSDPGDGLVAAVYEVRPGQGCFSTQALIFPAVGVRLARDARPVTFREYAYTEDCD